MEFKDPHQAGLPDIKSLMKISIPIIGPTTTYYKGTCGVGSKRDEFLYGAGYLKGRFVCGQGI